MKNLSIKKVLAKLLNAITKMDRAYGFTKAPNAYEFNSTTTTRSLTTTITTHGRPVLLACTGDINPLSGQTTGAWAHITFYRDSTELSYQICQSTGASVNTPFSMAYLDIIPAGTYTYQVQFMRGAGNFSMTESRASQSPNFIAIEI